MKIDCDQDDQFIVSSSLGEYPGVDLNLIDVDKKTDKPTHKDREENIDLDKSINTSSNTLTNEKLTKSD